MIKLYQIDWDKEIVPESVPKNQTT